MIDTELECESQDAESLIAIPWRPEYTGPR
jgi:hypothetical protein